MEETITEVCVDPELAKAKAEQKKYELEKLGELKQGLIKDYTNNAERLKAIPNELKQIEDSEKYFVKDIELKNNKMNLQSKDLGLRRDNFDVVRDQVKFTWELNPDWLANQKELLKAEIDLIAHNVQMNRESLTQTKSNLGMQKADIERQQERCMDAHKVAIKRLREECKLPETEISKLKKLCASPCCR